jgi:hypothetical protein
MCVLSRALNVHTITLPSILFAFAGFASTYVTSFAALTCAAVLISNRRPFQEDHPEAYSGFDHFNDISRQVIIEHFSATIHR